MRENSRPCFIKGHSLSDADVKKPDFSHVVANWGIFTIPEGGKNARLALLA